MCPGNSRNRTHSISPKTRIPWERQDGGKVGGRGVHLSPQMHQEDTFRHRSCRTRAENGQEYWQPEKNMQYHAEPSRMKEGGEKEEGEPDWTCTWWGGTGGGLLNAGVRSPHGGNYLGQTRSIWECWRVQRLLCDRLNGMRITWTILAAALPTQDRDTSRLGAGA